MTGFWGVLYPTLPTCRKTSLHSEVIELEGERLPQEQEESNSPAAPPLVTYHLPPDSPPNQADLRQGGSRIPSTSASHWEPAKLPCASQAALLSSHHP